MDEPETVFTDLTLGNIYRVIGIEAASYRIINDEGRPYLYPPALFAVIESGTDPDWVTTYGPDGERYSYTPELGRPGFFEDFFADDRDAILTFRRYTARIFRSP
ncbi:MAG: hypothetical protein KF795_13365 [Labilithrix sp.]|nr:hypothetical protein [Labilithrix sp.]